MKLELNLPEEKPMSDEDRKAYVASVSAVFPRLEKDIKIKMYEHLVDTYTNSDEWDKVLRGQGILEGMAILLEHWRGVHMEQEEKTIDEPDSDPTSIVGEI